MNFRARGVGLIAALGFLVVSPLAFGQATVVRGNAENLIVRHYVYVAAGATLDVWSTGCTGNEDTVMALLQGTYTGITTTRGFADDFAGVPGENGYCARLNYQNTTGADQYYTLLVWSYSQTTTGSVTLQRRINGGVWTDVETVNFGGLRVWAGAAVAQSAPVRTSEGGSANGDTILYWFDTALGSLAQYDDDSGFRRLSRLTRTGTCHLCIALVGNYYANAYIPVGTVEFWLPNNTDSDGDGAMDGVEYWRGTSSSTVDTDGDGLSDFEELMGVPDTFGNLAGGEASLLMPWQGQGGANPTAQDVFVEVDYMQATSGGSPHDHDPRLMTNWNTFQNDMTAIFQNDTAFTGRTIRTHVEISQAMTESAQISFVTCSGALNFYTRKNDSSFFDPLRASIYHYAIMAHNVNDPSNCNAVTSSGWAEVWGNDLIVSLGSFTNQVGSVNEQRGTTLHEFGHNLGLVHNNNGNTSANSCVHSSVMNYRYQTTSWAGGTIPAMRGWGYSNGACPASGNGCANTCVSSCVPNTETSPKAGCSSNNGSCDCDRSEWANLLLDIPSAGLTSYQACQVSNCSGSAAAAMASVRHDFLRPYFLSDRGRLNAHHREYAGKRKEFLRQRGLVEGEDFVQDSETGRTYVIE